MGLLAEIEANSPVKGPRCGIDVAYDQLDKADAADLAAALDRAARGDGVTYVAIAKALTGRGYRVAASTVSRHARGECGCGPR